MYLTGGSFGHIMVQFLPKDFNYTVVVNSVDMAKELRDFENIDVYIAGGKMRRSGPVAVFVGARTPKLHAAASSLHFAPPKEVQWQAIFSEKRLEDITVELE